MKNYLLGVLAAGIVFIFGLSIQQNKIISIQKDMISSLKAESAFLTNELFKLKGIFDPEYYKETPPENDIEIIEIKERDEILET